MQRDTGTARRLRDAWGDGDPSLAEWIRAAAAEASTASLPGFEDKPSVGVVVGFVRLIKGHDDIADLDAHDAFDTVDETEPDWIGWLGVMLEHDDREGDDGFVDLESVRDAFELAWDNTHKPFGTGELWRALRLAEVAPLDLTTTWPNATPQQAMAASILAWLQVDRQHDVDPFISWASLSWALRCRKERAGEILRSIRARDLMRVTGAGGQGQFMADGARAATVFRFPTFRFPELFEHYAATDLARARERFEQLPLSAEARSRAEPAAVPQFGRVSIADVRASRANRVVAFTSPSGEARTRTGTSS